MTVLDIDLRQVILNVCQKYNFTMEHGFQVEKFALTILEFLKGFKSFSTDDETLLSHASLIHDIGSYINKKGHHKLSRYLVKHDELLDSYPEHERLLLSILVFNHRKKIHEDDMKLLHSETVEKILDLTAILRLADALYSQKYKVSDIKIEDNFLEVLYNNQLPPKFKDKVNAKGSLFMERFNLKLLIVSKE